MAGLAYSHPTGWGPSQRKELIVDKLRPSPPCGLQHAGPLAVVLLLSPDHHVPGKCQALGAQKQARKQDRHALEAASQKDE